MGLPFGEGGGKPKIDDLNLPVFANDDIISFDISMRNPIQMEIGNSLCYFNGNLFLFILWQTVPILPDILLQSFCSHHELKEQMDL